jgi:hypothetical protein
MSRQQTGLVDPPPRATVHPERCRFCGSTEFWNLGVGISSGVNVKTGERSSWIDRTVRCVKCHATFNTFEGESRPIHSHERIWRLGRA